MQKVDAIVFVTKYESGEFGKYALDASGRNMNDRFSADVEFSDGGHFKSYKYYHDSLAQRLILVFDSNDRQPKIFANNQTVSAEFEKELCEVRDVVRKVIDTLCSQNKIQFSGEVIFLRHFGGGVSRNNVYRQELRMQEWIKRRSDFSGWYFLLISSVRPDLFNLRKCLIPIGDELRDFVTAIKSGVFNVRTLQDEQCANLLRKWKEVGYSTNADVVLFIGVEFDGTHGSMMQNILENELWNDNEFNEPSSSRFVITQNGVRYSNWQHWGGETSLIQVVQRLRQSGERVDNVLVWQVGDDYLDGFVQIVCKEFGHCVECAKSVWNDVLFYDEKKDDEFRETREELRVRQDLAIDFLKNGAASSVVKRGIKITMGLEGKVKNADAKAMYNQVMKELGH